MTVCPVEGCNEQVAPGRNAFFCIDHALMLEPAQRRFLLRMARQAETAPDERVREHLAAQLPGYINATARRLHQSETTRRGQPSVA